MNKTRTFQYALLALILGPIAGMTVYGAGKAIAQAVNSSSQVNIGATKVTVNSPPNDVVKGPQNVTGTTSVAVNAQGTGSTGIDVRGTGSGMVYIFEGSVDGTNYVTIPCVVPLSGAIVTGGSANGTWTCQSAGYQLVRIRFTSFSSGTASVTLNASAGSNQPPIGTQGTATNITAVGGNAVTTTVPVSGTFTPSGNTTVVQATASNLNATVVQPTAANLNATVVGTGTLVVQETPTTTGGLSVYTVQPAASDNHAVIKAGAGQVYKISITNNSSTINYIRLYNATTGFNGCNSATNLVYSNLIPSATTGGAGIVDYWAPGMAFATGISICVTSGYANTDTTAATASAMNVNIGYK